MNIIKSLSNVGVMFSVGVLSHRLKIADALVGMLSSLSKILSSFIYAFAVTRWQLYLGLYHFKALIPENILFPLNAYGHYCLSKNTVCPPKTETQEVS